MNYPFVSPHVGSHTLTSSRSPAAILNPPENVLEDERSDHMLHIFQNISVEPRRFKSPGQGADLGPSQGSSRIPPGRLRNLFSSRRKQTAHLLSSTRRIHPPYPCIGHFSPPSPSATSLKRAAPPDPSAQSPPWPSKGPCCRCLW